MNANETVTVLLAELTGDHRTDRIADLISDDYWEHLDWRLWPDLAAFQTAHSAAHPGRCHYFTTKTTRRYTEARYQPGDFLVFGRESKGLPAALLAEHADACVTLPMANPAVRSLNLATSVGIGLYEALRQLDAWEK